MHVFEEKLSRGLKPAEGLSDTVLEAAHPPKTITTREVLTIFWHVWVVVFVAV